MTAFKKWKSAQTGCEKGRLRKGKVPEIELFVNNSVAICTSTRLVRDQMFVVFFFFFSFSFLKKLIFRKVYLALAFLAFLAKKHPMSYFQLLWIIKQLLVTRIPLFNG